MPLPTAADVHLLAFSQARYGKHSYGSDYDHPFWYGGLRLLRGGPQYQGALDDDDEDEREVYGYSKLAERCVPTGHDGALERMTKLPVDILYEIFNHLHPTELLHLSRANKYMRSILYEEHARGVWRAALSSVRALPACPPDMTEQQYASLAFDDWCHVSGMLDLFFLVSSVAPSHNKCAPALSSPLCDQLVDDRTDNRTRQNWGSS
ncbi:hypothetical protein BDN70DRAFT_811091 [Pholiota conissans]|uniref:F-box domain-containing protein n=1 Tax=Pholiota conissans TaxID=109636 RepID=A0A9P5Z016_9AGAR|nr:hypothetical protein BDN70DRAFT_811091 [Pholiota conissans]